MALAVQHVFINFFKINLEIKTKLENCPEEFRDLQEFLDSTLRKIKEQSRRNLISYIFYKGYYDSVF